MYMIDPFAHTGNKISPGFEVHCKWLYVRQSNVTHWDISPSLKSIIS